MTPLKEDNKIVVENIENPEKAKENFDPLIGILKTSKYFMIFVLIFKLMKLQFKTMLFTEMTNQKKTLVILCKSLKQVWGRS